MILQSATLSACGIHKNLLELMFRGCSHDCQQDIYCAVFATTARKGTQVVGDLLSRHFIARLIYTHIFSFLSILIYQVNQLDLWHLIVLLLHCYSYQHYQDFEYT